MTLGIALLGTGSIAQRAFVPAVRAVAGARLVAVLSRERARGRAFAQQHDIPEVYDRLEALLLSPQVDAVIVATPDALHEPQVIAAAQAGKHILCEKPLATTYAGGQRMAAAVRASGITFAMGYICRFNNALRQVKKLLEAGSIGAVRYARAFMTTQAQNPNGWRAQREQAHYWALSATGTHLIDLWRWYFGEPAHVGGCLATPVHHGPNDEISTLVLDYPGRLLAELCATAILRSGNRLELYGEQGNIIGENVLVSSQAGPLTCNGQPVAYQAANPFLAEVADFVQAIEQRRTPEVTIEDGLRSVYIMETARTGPLLRPLAYPGGK
jgi:1,5-anhydro-D-fructose reductase (1,5-anhydro-D-mannitol-forming)